MILDQSWERYRFRLDLLEISSYYTIISNRRELDYWKVYYKLVEID